MKSLTSHARELELRDNLTHCLVGHAQLGLVERVARLVRLLVLRQVAKLNLGLTNEELLVVVLVVHATPKQE